MPIYEYRCGECGFQKEFLQRMSDAPMKDCPECGKPALKKMVSAAGFQLKGTGWYATDFKSSGTKPAAGKDKSTDKPADAAKSGDASTSTSTATSATTSTKETPKTDASGSTGASTSTPAS